MRHLLTDVDETSQQAYCVACKDRVDVTPHGEDWRCGVAYRAAIAMRERHV